MFNHSIYKTYFHIFGKTFPRLNGPFRSKFPMSRTQHGHPSLAHKQLIKRTGMTMLGYVLLYMYQHNLKSAKEILKKYYIEKILSQKKSRKSVAYGTVFVKIKI